MSRFFQSLFDLGLRRPTWTLGLSLTLLLGSLWQIRNLNINLDLYAQVEKEIPSTQIFQEQRHRFGDVFNMAMLFAAKDLTRGELCDIQEWIRTRIDHHPELVSAGSPFDLRTARQEGDRIWYRHYVDLKCGDPNRKNEVMDLTPFRKTPWGLLATGKEGGDIGAEFVFRETAAGSHFGQFDPRPVGVLIEDAEKYFAENIPRLNVYAVGSAAFQSYLQKALHADMALQGLAALIFLFAFRYVLGTWRSGVVFIFSLVFNLILVFGGMAAAGHPLDLLTNNLPLMIAISGLEDFLFVAYYMKLQRVGWREAMRKMITPCFFTTLTTVIGFISLESSGLEANGRFGLWAAYGAFAEWLVMFILLPPVFHFWPKTAAWVNFNKAAYLKWTARLAQITPPKWMSAVGVVLFIGGLYGFTQLNINEHPARNFSSDHMLTRSYNYVVQSRGWENAIPVIFESTDIADQRERVEEVLNQIAKHEMVVGTESPFTLADFLAQDLSGEMKEIPRSEVKITPAYRRLFSGRDQARATIYLKSSELSALGSVVQHISAVCADGFCKAGGQSVVYLEYAGKIVPALLSSFVSSAILVSAILLILAWIRGIRGKRVLVYSAMWGPVVMVGIMALLQVPVSLITSIFAATIVGLTGDNGIQYMFATDNKDLNEGAEERGECSVVLTLLLAACSLIFVLESVKPMKILGLLFFAGFLITLAGDLWMLRGLLSNDQKMK